MLVTVASQLSAYIPDSVELKTVSVPSEVSILDSMLPHHKADFAPQESRGELHRVDRLTQLKNSVHADLFQLS